MRIALILALVTLPLASAAPARQSQVQPPARAIPKARLVRATPLQRTQLARQITGNPKINAGATSMHFEVGDPVPLGRRMVIESAWYVDLPTGPAAMRPTAGRVTLHVGPQGAQLSGLHLFECTVTGSTLNWWASRRGGGPALTGSANTNGGKAAFVIDMGMVNGVQVALTAPVGRDWSFRACDVTPLS